MTFCKSKSDITLTNHHRIKPSRGHVAYEKANIDLNIGSVMK